MKKYHYNENLKIVADAEFFFKSIILDNSSFLGIPVKICYCEKAGISGDIPRMLEERIIAIKSLLPKRMSVDVDFIVKYNNPIIRYIGNLLYNKFLRKLYDRIIRRRK